jgi:ketosteroid isomerase-like protein
VVPAEPVPGENLALARQTYDAMNRGDIEGILELCHPDYEFHTGVKVPSIPAVVRGRDGLRAWVQQWYVEPWEEQLQMDIERLEELPDGRVLALMTLRAKGRESGVQVDTQYAHILTYEDGLCLRIDGFPAWKQALSAAGLAE